MFDKCGGNVPQRAICQNCGALLYQGMDLRPPEEIIQQYNGKCPKCGKKLSSIPKDVEVSPVE
jgi:ribosomal protein L34E